LVSKKVDYKFAYQTVGFIMKDSKEHILETAFILFMQKGFKAVTIEDIVEKTGMSKGAFYHYFTSKKDLFSEVVNDYILKIMNIDYDKISHKSLKDFYTNLKKIIDSKSTMMHSINLAKETGEAFNYYWLIFDAMRILPEFKKTFFEIYKNELKSWIKIVRIAKKSGEIKTELSDEKVAKLFVYANDGAGLNLILTNNADNLGKKIMAIHDCIYDLLKK
jgi:TetR/AcrR family transcriptional repressor of nem operon